MKVNPKSSRETKSIDRLSDDCKQDAWFTASAFDYVLSHGFIKYTKLGNNISSEDIVNANESLAGSVPCRNPKKETKVVAEVVATRCRKPFLYVANMVATITKNCDQ